MMLVPVADARQRRVHHDPARDAARKLRRERVADHVADVVRDEIGLLDLQMIEHAGDVERLVLLRVARVRMRRKPHAAKIRRDDRVILHEHRGERRPHVAGIAEAVQQEDGRTLAADAHVQRRAVGRDLFGAEAIGKRLDVRGGGFAKVAANASVKHSAKGAVGHELPDGCECRRKKPEAILWLAMERSQANLRQEARGRIGAGAQRFPTHSHPRGRVFFSTPQWLVL